MAFFPTRGVRCAAIAIVCAFGAACGGGGGGGGGANPTPQNRAPTLTLVQFNATEDTALSAQVTGSDADGDALTFTRTSDPANGAVSAFNANGSFTYQPRADFVGSDSFGVRVADAQGGAVTGTVTIQVAGVDDPVAARPDARRVDGAGLDSIDVLENDHNPDGKSVTVMIDEAPSVGTAVVGADGAIRITDLPAGFHGVTRFTYRVTETNGAFSTAGAAIFVGVDPFRVAFVGDEAGNGSPEIFLTDLAGPPLRMTAATEGALRMRSQWASQNGATIVYRRNNGNNVFHDLSFVRTSEPSVQHRIQFPAGTRYFQTSIGFDEYAVSPDGQWIAAVFAAEQSGNGGVFLFNVDDPTALYTPTPASTTNASLPFFSPDSRYLYFRAQENAPWRLYRTALTSPQEATPLSIATTGDVTEGVTGFAMTPDQTRVVFHATREGVEHIYFVDLSNPGVETRLTHDSGRDPEIASSTVFNPSGNTLGGSADGRRIAYTVGEAGAFVSYVVDVSSTPNPRPVGAPGMFVRRFRSDEAALLCEESVTDPVRQYIDYVYEAPIDSSQPHTLVGEGFNPRYSAVDDAILMQHVTYEDPSFPTLTVRAAIRSEFGVSRHVGTPGLASRALSFNGVNRGVAFIGERAPSESASSSRLALVTPWAPDRLLYLAPFESPHLFSGRAMVVDAANAL